MTISHTFVSDEQERIRIGKELLEAKRIEEDNERKRCGFFHVSALSYNVEEFFKKFYFMCSLIMLRKAEKEEEQRAREKIRLKLEEDKVIFLSFFCQTNH